MRRALARISRWVRADGVLGIADFAPLAPARSSRVVQYAYYRPLNVAAWLLRLAALHPIYDYDLPLCELGWQVEQREGFRVPAAGPILYQTLIARRSPAG
jgi:hypothetical protein